MVTDDNHLTLYGFRRFRTAHLLSLRFLENEIHHIDYQLFQAGLRLGSHLRGEDRLGLRHSTFDPYARGPEIINEKLVLKLRQLLRDYGIPHS